MGNSIESRDERRHRLYKNDLVKWLKDNNRQYPTIILDAIRSRWDMFGENEAEKAILAELGWTLSGPMLKRIETHPPVQQAQQETPITNELSIAVPYKRPTFVLVHELPKVSRPGPKSDSDGMPYRLDEDA